MTASSAENRERIGQLFKLNYQWLCARVRARMDCPHNAEDIAAETFARVLTMPDPAAFREPRALLSTIAQRLIYEGWRRRDLSRAYLQAMQNIPEVFHPSPEEQMMLIESLMAIDQLLDGLNRQAKAVFILNQIEGLPYSKICERLGISLGTVHGYMAQALRCCYHVFES
ncbi:MULTISPECIES: sigma-70 family RNA polymerase sigma factor [unclassified Pseudomonas]|uniref:sigma-70 family RNA polymerase sigma factor n=1 Tax=unclassified Pseudomonas TaxID=196821 RepID=UPI000BA31492|nr:MULTISPECIES: sigma-70 family RNA polymerase sigma factor [unclassified Pseudomonas]MCU1722553.1 sigma-70 family RNA polymerase sigma factor [Pseudomonas sp. 5P_5.1_Bac1]